ncbi:MAG: tetratricopeptide repeat protein, partial [Phocaeicola sp.]
MIDLNNVTRLLDSNRLKEALQELHFLSTTIQDWQLQTDIEEVQTAYTYMLQYMKQGVEEPNRKELYNKLTQKAYKLKDRVYIAHASKSDNSHFFETVRSKSKNPGRSFGEILNFLELHAEQSFYFSSEQKRAQLKQHDDALVELFEKAWVLSIWSEADTEEVGKYLTSILIPDGDLALLVSAVTMSMIRTFDVNKLLFLCDAYDHEHVITSQRALIGIAITILHHDSRICKDSKAMKAINRLKELNFFHRELHHILMQLLLTRETQKIDKKMREEIIPGIQKATKLKNKRFGMEDIEEFDENNPDWEEMLKGSDVEKQVKELGELQMSGADLYMSSFSQLKNYPFFYDMAHWFFQFDTEQIDLTIILGEQQRE